MERHKGKKTDVRVHYVPILQCEIENTSRSVAANPAGGLWCPDPAPKCLKEVRLTGKDKSSACTPTTVTFDVEGRRLWAADSSGNVWETEFVPS